MKKYTQALDAPPRKYKYINRYIVFVEKQRLLWPRGVQISPGEALGST